MIKYTINEIYKFNSNFQGRQKTTYAPFNPASLLPGRYYIYMLYVSGKMCWYILFFLMFDV